MQLSAFLDVDTPEAGVELIRVVNEIRKEHGDLHAPWPHDMLNLYWAHIVPPDEHRAAFLSAIPPQDHLDPLTGCFDRPAPARATR